MTQIQFLNTRTGDRSPRNETREPFDADKLFRFERAEFGSDLAFLLERPASPIPTVVYASKTPIVRRKDRKTRSQRIAENRNMYLQCLSFDEWMPKKEICRKLDKSPSQVSERMSAFAEDGLVLRSEVRTGNFSVAYYKLAKSTNLQKD